MKIRKSLATILSRKPLFGDRAWPIAIVTMLTGAVAINLAIVTVAFRHKPEVVTEDYYAKGYNLRELQQKEAAGAATGWKVAVKQVPSGIAVMPLLQIDIREANGSGADSLSGSVGLYRASDKGLDIPSQPLQEQGGGLYYIKLPRPLERGSWQALVSIHREQQRLDKRISFFVEE